MAVYNQDWKFEMQDAQRREQRTEIEDTTTININLTLNHTQVAKIKTKLSRYEFN